jgi:glycosyltransferase involved in cell wall biosynthesis
MPTYNDIIPGTIIESMFRKVSVVSYKTGGIPDINKKDINIELIETGNVKELSERILYLLENEEYRKNLAKKAYKYATDRWDNKKSLNDIIEIYHQIIDNES